MMQTASHRGAIVGGDYALRTVTCRSAQKVELTVRLVQRRKAHDPGQRLTGARVHTVWVLRRCSTSRWSGSTNKNRRSLTGKRTRRKLVGDGTEGCCGSMRKMSMRYT